LPKNLLQLCAIASLQNMSEAERKEVNQISPSDKLRISSKEKNPPPSEQNVSNKEDSAMHDNLKKESIKQTKEFVLPSNTLSMITEYVQQNQQKIFKEIQSQSKPSTDHENHTDFVTELSFPDLELDGDSAFVSELSFPDLDLDGDNCSSKHQREHRKRTVSLKKGERIKKKKQKTKTQQAQDSEAKDGNSVKAPRPNYFIAIRISDSQIASAARDIQTSIQELSTVDYSPAFIGLEKFHITLMVFHLASSDDVKRTEKT